MLPNESIAFPAPPPTRMPKTIMRQQLALKTQEFPLKRKRGVYDCWDGAHLALQLWDIDTIGIHEAVCCMYLNKANVPIGWAELSRGGISGCAVDFRLVIAHALLCCSSAIMLFHNHPSGNLSPSPSDIDITRRLKECCNMMDIQLLDHIILAPDGSYHSLASSNAL